ncbi:MAG: phosphate acetyltransferase [Dactylosporangium sp.]|nr:phosphate acetyltransferase [Dactylosporangium sp.]NNJ59757.1 phosphate acetyltransferase [Dactylosporangium sp.]
MARSVYVAGVARGAGKSVVALGVAELLSRRVDRLGVFRPLVADASDRVLALLRERYRITTPVEQLYGATYAEAAHLLAEGRSDELVATIVDRYRMASRPGVTTLVIGSDIADRDEDSRYPGAPHELTFHARLAAEFGSVVLPVVDAHRRREGADGRGSHHPEDIGDQVRAVYHTLDDLGAAVLAIVVNRLPLNERNALLGCVESLPIPVYAVPAVPELSAPTVAEIGIALHASMIVGDEAALARDVRNIIVGGATVPTFLDYLSDGCLVITPGDRADLIVAACAAHGAGAVSLAGIMLTLGVPPDPRAIQLVQRMDPGLAVLSVPDDSFSTVREASRIEARLSSTTLKKVEVALGAFEDSVDTAGLGARIAVARSERVTPMMFEYDLIERARANRRRLVLPEGGEERVLRATEVLLRRGVADLTLLGEQSEINRRARELGVDITGAMVVDPASSPWREQFAQLYADLRKHKGTTLDRARDSVTDVNYFGTLMVQAGYADGMVSGAVHTTAATIRPAFEIIKTRPGVGVASSVFFMCLADRVLVYGDCAVNPDPDAEQLADIAISSAETALRFGVEPRVAMLSYSTGTSGSGAEVAKVARATALVRNRCPNLLVEGPIQYDAAIDPEVAATKLPDSAVAGSATVFIFPDLNTGNNTYKAVQRSARAVAVGPVLQGLRRPVNDLSRGATVTDIVNTVAITAIQAAGESNSP